MAIKHFQDLVNAALLTLQISVLSLAMGLAIGVILSVWWQSRNPFLFWFVAIWVGVARNTPALLQIYLCEFGLGALGIHLSSYTAVLAAIIISTVGYLAEILRGGIDAVNLAQRRAALGRGMTPFQVYARIIFP